MTTDVLMAWGDISQIQAGAHIEKLHAQTSSPAVRRSDNADDMLRVGNMDTHQRVRKNDTIDATQNAPTHHTNEKKIQKDRLTRTRTATCHSITILKKILILQRFKKKIGSTT